MFTKLFAIVVIVWFYKTAENKGKNKIQWPVIGLVGYYIFVGLTYFLVSKPLLDFYLNQAKWLSLTLGHLPALVGIIAAVFIRKRLLSGKI